MSKDLRKLKEVSEGLKKYYQEYYLRNTQKFIRKYTLTEEDLGKSFTMEEGDFTLEGQVGEKIFLVKKTETGDYYHIDGSYVNGIMKPKK
jgi:hypothetical protein